METTKKRTSLSLQERMIKYKEQLDKLQKLMEKKQRKLITDTFISLVKDDEETFNALTKLSKNPEIKVKLNDEVKELIFLLLKEVENETKTE
ncbi:MAG: hypothetical protein ACRC4T_22645 [Cetobacterium sp.]